MTRLNLVDNQQALSFLVSQQTTIESEVYRTQYPEIIYPSLMYVDTTASEWAKSITYFGMDKVGEAAWFSGMANDMRFADINKAKYEQGIEMAGIGYRYTLEELGQAMMIPGLNLSAERADAARFASEQFIDRLVRIGDATKGVKGLINSSTPTRADAPNGASGHPDWARKTADEMIADVQNALLGIYTGSNSVEMADTVLLPLANMSLLSSTRLSNTNLPALQYLATNNLYTFTTGQPLKIKGILNLDTAGSGGVARMIIYRNDRQVLKFHMPMPYRFLPVWQTGPMTFDVPGIFRVGSVEIRRPAAVRYVDGI